jgi:hypothetical protein
MKAIHQLDTEGISVFVLETTDCDLHFVVSVADVLPGMIEGTLGGSYNGFAHFDYLEGSGQRCSFV